jgi:hypothetical protein
MKDNELETALQNVGKISASTPYYKQKLNEEAYAFLLKNEGKKRRPLSLLNRLRSHFATGLITAMLIVILLGAASVKPNQLTVPVSAAELYAKSVTKYIKKLTTEKYMQADYTVNIYGPDGSTINKLSETNRLLLGRGQKDKQLRIRGEYIFKNPDSSEIFEMFKMELDEGSKMYSCANCDEAKEKKSYKIDWSKNNEEPLDEKYILSQSLEANRLMCHEKTYLQVVPMFEYGIEETVKKINNQALCDEYLRNVGFKDVGRHTKTTFIGQHGIEMIKSVGPESPADYPQNLAAFAEFTGLINFQKQQILIEKDGVEYISNLLNKYPHKELEQDGNIRKVEIDLGNQYAWRLGIDETKEDLTYFALYFKGKPEFEVFIKNKIFGATLPDYDYRGAEYKQIERL